MDVIRPVDRLEFNDPFATLLEGLADRKPVCKGFVENGCELFSGRIPHRPVRTDIVSHAGAQESFGEADVSFQSFCNGIALFLAPGCFGSPDSCRLTGFEKDQSREFLNIDQVQAG